MQIEVDESSNAGKGHGTLSESPQTIRTHFHQSRFFLGLQ